MGAWRESASLRSQPRANESDVHKQVLLFRGDETPKRIPEAVWSCPYMLPAFDGNFPSHRGSPGRTPRGTLRAHQNFRRTRGAYLQRGVRLRYGKVVVMYKIPSGTHTHTARLPKRSGASGADVAPASSPNQTLGTRRRSFPGPGRGTPGGHAMSSDDSMLEPSLSYLRQRDALIGVGKGPTSLSIESRETRPSFGVDAVKWWRSLHVS
ncbi:unnamed protein product [Ixodes pacificus]